MKNKQALIVVWIRLSIRLVLVHQHRLTQSGTLPQPIQCTVHQQPFKCFIQSLSFPSTAESSSTMYFQHAPYLGDEFNRQGFLSFRGKEEQTMKQNESLRRRVQAEQGRFAFRLKIFLASGLACHFVRPSF